MATVALVGRPNVGKSTLFNRIALGRYAITDDQPGVTRDRLYAIAEWLTRRFELIDTGGLTMSDAPFQKEIAFQVGVAVEEADLVVLVLAATDGVTADDRYVAKQLKKAHKSNVVVCINKADGKQKTDIDSDATTLGYGPGIKVSAEHGMGVGDLLDKIVLTVDPLIKAEKDIEKDTGLKLAVIGKPNVGKSTLVNSLVGKRRAIVSPTAGTTRDSTDTRFVRNKEVFTIIDTAGIRRKGAVADSVEKYSVLRAHKALARCDVALIVIDASQPIDHQDMIVAGLAHEANLPTVIVANKWDALTKDGQTIVIEEKKVRDAMQYLAWAPVVFISAQENHRLDKLFEAIHTIQLQAKKQLPRSLLREVIAKAQITNNPPRIGGKRLEVFDIQQIESRIPTFTLFCNDPQLLHFSFSRYLENALRQAFGLTHVPMTLYFKPFGRTRNKKG